MTTSTTVSSAPNDANNNGSSIQKFMVQKNLFSFFGKSDSSPSPRTSELSTTGKSEPGLFSSPMPSKDVDSPKMGCTSLSPPPGGEFFFGKE